MQDSKTALNIYVGLFAILTLTEFFESSLFVSLVRGLFILWSFSYFVKVLVNFKKEPLFIKSLIILFVMFAVYGTLPVLEGKTFHVTAISVKKVISYAYLLKISISLLPIFVFYSYAKKGILTKRYICNSIWFLFAVVTLYYLLMRQTAMGRNDTDEITNNAGYRVLSIIPLLMFLKAKSLKQILFLVYCLLLIILAMKRGAILCSLIVVGIYFLYLLRGKRKSSFWTAIIIICLSVGFLIFAFDRMMSKSELFQERVEETLDGNSSERDTYYLFFLNYYLNETTEREFLLGRGANGTLEIWSNYAHNDWLEIAINQGLLGVAIYLVFWICFLALCLKKIDAQFKTVLWMLFSIYFLKTFFSMSYDQYTLYASIALGYCVAFTYAKKTKVSINTVNSLLRK